MDKLFLRGELLALRCSFKNLPILYPVLIGSLFHEVFYTKDGLYFPLAHRYRSVRPTRLGLSGLIFCFYPLQLAPSPHLARRYLRKGINWGDGQINPCWRFYVHGLTVEIRMWTATNFSLDDDGKCWVDGVIINKVTVWNLQWTMTWNLGWRFGEYEPVRGTEFWQAVQRHLWLTTRVVRRLVCISDRSVASSSVHSIYKNQNPSFHFLAFHRKYIVRASLSPIRDPFVQLLHSKISSAYFFPR